MIKTIVELVSCNRYNLDSIKECLSEFVQDLSIQEELIIGYSSAKQNSLKFETKDLSMDGNVQFTPKTKSIFIFYKMPEHKYDQEKLKQAARTFSKNVEARELYVYL